MNKQIIKIIILLSIFGGIVSGLLAIVPYIGEFIFWIIVLLLSAPCIILFLMKQGLVEISSVRQSVVIGGMIGFVVFLAFSAVYIPAVVILAKYLNYSINYGVTLFVSHASFWLTVVLVVFMGIFVAVTNAFSAFLTYYITEFFKACDDKKQYDEIQFDIRKQR